jgi:hypothetical protein
MTLFGFSAVQNHGFELKDIPEPLWRLKLGFQPPPFAILGELERNEPEQIFPQHPLDAAHDSPVCPLDMSRRRSWHDGTAGGGDV